VNRLLLKNGMAQDLATAKTLQNGMSPEYISQLLREASPAALIALANPERLRLYAAPRVLKDGYVLPKEPWLEAIASGRFHKVPLITGTNRDERRLYQFLEPRWRKTMREAPGDYVLYAHYGSLAWKQLAVDDVARAMLKAGHREVWAYRFDWDEQGAIEGLDLSLAIGAGHAVELPFVFGTSSSLTPGLDGMTEPSRAALSSSIMSYWAQHAYAGTPGRGRDSSEVAWQPFNERADEPCLLLLDTAADGGVRMCSERIDRPGLRRAVVEETGFVNKGLHAQLYRGLFSGSGFDEAEYQRLTARV
jgi:para-nitrobenzyl esterase